MRSVINFLSAAFSPLQQDSVASEASTTLADMHHMEA